MFMYALVVLPNVRLGAHKFSLTILPLLLPLLKQRALITAYPSGLWLYLRTASFKREASAL